MSRNCICRFGIAGIVCLVIFAGTAPAVSMSITFNWDAAGTSVNQLADTGYYSLAVTVDANAGQITLGEGASVTRQLQDYHWAMSNDSTGLVGAHIDRDLTINGVTQTVDQDFRFSSYYWSLIGMNLKSGALYESPVMTYDFGLRGVVDVQFLYDPMFDPPSIGTGGTAGSGLISQNNGVVARFSAHDIIVPEPAALSLLALGVLAALCQRKRRI